MESDFTGDCPSIDGTPISRQQDSATVLRAFMCIGAISRIQKQCTSPCNVLGRGTRGERRRCGRYELLFTASPLGLAKRISDTSRIAPTTMALSATLKS